MRKIKTFKAFNERNQFDNLKSEYENPLDDLDLEEDYYDEDEDVEDVEDVDYEDEDVDYDDNSEKEPVTFEEAKTWIVENFNQDKVSSMLNSSIDDWSSSRIEEMEKEGYDNSYDYYVDHGNGEAEASVIENIVNNLESKFYLEFNKFDDDTNIYEFIKTIFDFL